MKCEVIVIKNLIKQNKLDLAIQELMDYADKTGANNIVAVSYTHLLALELAPNIRVNTVAPSYIDTPMTRREPEKDAMRQALVANYPLQRIGYIEDVTPAILYLLSDQASFITGEILSVAGGYGEPSPM